MSSSLNKNMSSHTATYFPSDMFAAHASLTNLNNSAYKSSKKYKENDVHRLQNHDGSLKSPDLLGGVLGKFCDPGLVLRYDLSIT